jgi:glyceraldehyde-3-phosphate dehydrogenase type II
MEFENARTSITPVAMGRTRRGQSRGDTTRDQILSAAEALFAEHGRDPTTDVLEAFRRSSRIALIRIGDGLVAFNAVKELMADRGRPHDNLYEVALWADMLRVQDDELFYAYMVDNQAIVIPEPIDAIRALSGIVRDANESIAKTNATLGVEATLI